MDKEEEIDWSSVRPLPMTFPVPDWPEEKFEEVIRFVETELIKRVGIN